MNIRAWVIAGDETRSFRMSHDTRYLSGMLDFLPDPSDAPIGSWMLWNQPGTVGAVTLVCVEFDVGEEVVA